MSSDFNHILLKKTEKYLKEQFTTNKNSVTCRLSHAEGQFTEHKTFLEPKRT